MPDYNTLPSTFETKQAVDFAIAWLNRAIRFSGSEGAAAAARTHLYVALTALTDAEGLLPGDHRRASDAHLVASAARHDDA